MADQIVAVGTYTSRHPFGSRLGQLVRNWIDRAKPRAEGIYLLPFDARSGQLGTPRLAAEVPHPSWLARHPREAVLYAGSEVPGGLVTAFRFDGAGLEPIGTHPTGGDAPCFVAVDPGTAFLFATNYASGTVAACALRPDGTFGNRLSVWQHEGSGADHLRQRSAHPHSVAITPDGRWAVVPDLGADKVVVYRLDPWEAFRTGVRLEFSTAAGAGPRHAVFDPAGKHLLLVNELDSTLQSFRLDPTSGNLEPVDRVSTLPAGTRERSTAADVRLHPDGGLAFVSNRGYDSIAAVSVSEEGKLEVLAIEPSRGKTPRGIAVDPAGGFLLAAHQDSDEVIAFAIERTTGRLREASHAHVPTCACVQFL